MGLRLKKLSSIEQVSFKGRNKIKNRRIKLVYGNSGFVICKNTQFEYAYFFLIKRFLKFLFKFKYSLGTYFKIWVILKNNFPVSKKSKNSRMGKGKGAFNRWVVNIYQGHTLMEFNNIDKLRLLKLLNYWNKLLKIKLIFIIK